MASNNTPPAQDDDGGAKTKMTLSLKSSSTGCNALVRKEVVEYWKSCSVLERISLTTIDKTTIIRKLKQRHKHRCSCENCMRRRVPYFDDEVHFYDQIVSILEKRDLETIDWDFEEKLQLPFCCHHSKEHQEQNEDNKEPSSHEDHEQSGIFLIFGQKLYIEEGMLKIHPKALAKQDLLLTILEKLKRVVEENHNMCEEQGKKEKNRTCEMCSACIAFEFLVCKAIVEKVSSAYNHRLAVMKADQMVQVLLKEEQQKSKQKMKKKKKKRSKRKDQDDDDEEDDDSNSVATMDSLNQFIHDDPVFGSLEDDNGSEESSQMEYDTGSSPTELSQEIDDAFDSENGDPFADFLEFREKEKWEVVSKPRKVKQVSAPSSSISSSSSSTSAPTQPQTPQKVAANQPPRQTRKHQSKLVLPPRLQQQLLNNSQHSPQHSKTQAYLPKDSLPSEDSIPSSTVFATQVFHTTIPFSGQYHTSCFSLPTIFGQYNSSPLYASWVMNPSPNNSLPANSNRSDSLYFGILV